MILHGRQEVRADPARRPCLWRVTDSPEACLHRILRPAEWRRSPYDARHDSEIHIVQGPSKCRTTECAPLTRGLRTAWEVTINQRMEDAMK